MKTLRIVNRFLDKFLFISVAISSSVFFLSVLLTIFTRYFKIPIQSAIEISRLFFIWACFLAAVVTYRKKAHVAISFFTGILKPHLGNYLHKFSILACLVFFMTIIYYGLAVSLKLWNTEFPVLHISQGWLYLSVPVSSVFFVLYSIEELFIKATE